MSLVLTLDPDITKMYVCTENEVPSSWGSSSKDIAWTDTQACRQTDRHMHTHTDSIEIITYLHTQMVIKIHWMVL